ncbi:predicted protein [Chaetomium globosum CBS 148.51]|uniref:Uncharacterized protein n=1 Tax=Chaetomium globosum (strain ATCC 6205 / CBS 148.51 / DSM 1962 / NBRC 6347 / NRRL 1970) TaxID=306901 RepID=Q2H8L3_CHAGB|nr:uncharacterized protein CHGG_03441 [Chaetomium globosum CBS 148.51]EAQ91506.1 predicted protein [Chaetomium globosum CBS 148.51]
MAVNAVLSMLKGCVLGGLNLRWNTQASLPRSQRLPNTRPLIGTLRFMSSAMHTSGTIVSAWLSLPVC